MKPLFKKRVTAYIGKTELWTRSYKDGLRIRWPMSKFLIFSDHLAVKILHEEYKFDFKDIEKIELRIEGVRIVHKNPKIDEFVYVKNLFGAFPLYLKIMRIVKENKLKIRIENPFPGEKKVKKN